MLTKSTYLLTKRLKFSLLGICLNIRIFVFHHVKRTWPRVAWVIFRDQSSSQCRSTEAMPLKKMFSLSSESQQGHVGDPSEVRSLRLTLSSWPAPMLAFVSPKGNLLLSLGPGGSIKVKQQFFFSEKKKQNDSSGIQMWWGFVNQACSTSFPQKIYTSTSTDFCA